MWDNQMGEPEYIINSGGRSQNSNNNFHTEEDQNRNEYFDGSVSNSEKLTDHDRDMSPVYNEPMIIRSPEMDPQFIEKNSLIAS